jgi:hypothetical protein
MLILECHIKWLSSTLENLYGIRAFLLRVSLTCWSHMCFPFRTISVARGFWINRLAAPQTRGTSLFGLESFCMDRSLPCDRNARLLAISHLWVRRGPSRILLKIADNGSR